MVFQRPPSGVVLGAGLQGFLQGIEKFRPVLCPLQHRRCLPLGAGSRVDPGKEQTMATAAVARVDNQVPLDAETTVRRLEDFPEMLQALRDGDLVTVRLVWSQLCDCDGQRNLRMGKAKTH